MQPAVITIEQEQEQELWDSDVLNSEAPDGLLNFITMVLILC